MPLLFARFSPPWLQGLRGSEAREAAALYCVGVADALDMECDFAEDNFPSPAADTLREFEARGEGRVAALGWGAKRLDVLREDHVKAIVGGLRNESIVLGQAVMFKRRTREDARASAQALWDKIEKAWDYLALLKDPQLREELSSELANARLDAGWVLDGKIMSLELGHWLRVADQVAATLADGGVPDAAK